MRITPAQLECLLHYHYSPAQRVIDTEVEAQNHEHWVEYGALVKMGDGYFITNLGSKVVDGWLNFDTGTARAVPAEGLKAAPKPVVFNLPEGTQLVFNIGGQDE